MCVCACVHVYMCMYHLCCVQYRCEARRGHWIPWNQGYRWTLGVEPKAFGRTISANTVLTLLLKVLRCMDGARKYYILK